MPVEIPDAFVMGPELFHLKDVLVWPGWRQHPVMVPLDAQQNNAVH